MTVVSLRLSINALKNTTEFRRQSLRRKKDARRENIRDRIKEKFENTVIFNTKYLHSCFFFFLLCKIMLDMFNIVTKEGSPPQFVKQKKPPCEGYQG